MCNLYERIENLCKKRGVSQIDKKDERIDRLMTRVDGILESNKDLTKQLQRLIEKM